MNINQSSNVNSFGSDDFKTSSNLSQSMRGQAAAKLAEQELVEFYDRQQRGQAPETNTSLA